MSLLKRQTTVFLYFNCAINGNINTMGMGGRRGGAYIDDQSKYKELVHMEVGTLRLCSIMVLNKDLLEDESQVQP